MKTTINNIFLMVVLLSLSSITMAAEYKARWEFVGTNKATPWVPTHNPICGAGAKCACGAQNLCGVYKNGQTTYWWPNGCHASSKPIRCKVVKTH